MSTIQINASKPEDKAADVLVNAIAEIGRERNWSWLRWFTAEDNYRGYGFYDQVAHATPRKTYPVDI
tara:strand:+ start:536 stop:736 length:201 start_codon:yes stop_codon:yes gene_type:complete